MYINNRNILVSPSTKPTTEEETINIGATIGGAVAFLLLLLAILADIKWYQAREDAVSMDVELNPV